MKVSELILHLVTEDQDAEVLVDVPSGEDEDDTTMFVADDVCSEFDCDDKPIVRIACISTGRS